MLYRWPIYAGASIRFLPTSSGLIHERRIPCQSFACQIQEDLKALEDSKYIREPASTQYLAAHAQDAVSRIPPILPLAYKRNISLPRYGILRSIRRNAEAETSYLHLIKEAEEVKFFERAP
jgi:hypothetical protein